MTSDPGLRARDTLALLGTKGGPAIRPGSTMPTANLLRLGQHDIVVDCGLGVSRGLVDQGVSLSSLSLIFITHLHSDHYLELGPLLHTAWTAGLATPVRVFGPTGLERYWHHFLASMETDIRLRIDDEGRPDLRELVSFRSIDAGTVLSEPGLEVTAIRNAHPPLIDTFSLAFSNADKRVVFSGDTAPFEALSDFARGADLLVHEAMLEEALPALFARVGNGDERLQRHWMRSHTLAHDAADLAGRAGVGALALNHLIPSDDPAYTPAHWQHAARGFDGPLHVGSDGLIIPF